MERKMFKKYPKFLTKIMALVLLFSANAANANANGCVVLLYHHVANDTPKSTSISPKLFEQHLKYLQENNYNVLPLKTMLNQLKNKNLVDKCVVLTADDAYRSIAKNAYPLLQKYQMPMSVFVSTKSVNKNYKRMMNWQQMRDIQGEIMQFYNHSVSHPHFLDLDKSQIKIEVETAQNHLKKELGVVDKIFAYPYGEANPQIFQQLQDLGYIAFGQHSGALGEGFDLQHLPRFPMTSFYAKMDTFKLKVATLPLLIKHHRMSPILGEQNPPVLHLTFKEKLPKSEQKRFNCFASGGVEIDWKNAREVSIVAKKPLTDRRSKYNCTLPSREKGRYYWYSVQWINPEKAE
jgi:peptidoglycan/xylan/chitin deacetylase (PgdA/CDA1 family)